MAGNVKLHQVDWSALVDCPVVGLQTQKMPDMPLNWGGILAGGSEVLPLATLAEDDPENLGWPALYSEADFPVDLLTYVKR